MFYSGQYAFQLHCEILLDAHVINNSESANIPYCNWYAQYDLDVTSDDTRKKSSFFCVLDHRKKQIKRVHWIYVWKSRQTHHILNKYCLFVENFFWKKSFGFWYYIIHSDLKFSYTPIIFRFSLWHWNTFCSIILIINIWFQYMSFCKSSTFSKRSPAQSWSRRSIFDSEHFHVSKSAIDSQVRVFRFFLFSLHVLQHILIWWILDRPNQSLAFCTRIQFSSTMLLGSEITLCSESASKDQEFRYEK